MDFEEVIASFKCRIDYLSQEWSFLMDTTSQYGDDKINDDQLKTLEQKLDSVQEQNAAIIIDLSHLKKFFRVDESTSNNVFTALNSATGTYCSSPNVFMEARRNSGLPHIEMDNSPVDMNIHNRSNMTECKKEIYQYPLEKTYGYSTCPLKVNQNNENIGNKTLKLSHPHSLFEDQKVDITAPSHLQSYFNCYTKSNDEESKIIDSVYSSSDLNPYETEAADGALEIERFDLQMVENPDTVAELYREFLTVSVPKLCAFQKKFGKGQISKIPKIRTFQRRRALVAEIDKYAATHNKSIDESIQHFEILRIEKKKSVPWLYNNFSKLQDELSTI